MADCNKILHCDETCKRRVILAFDGSECSERAFNFYFDNIMREDDHIFIFHAFELPTMPAAPYPYGIQYYEDWQAVVQQSDAEAKHLLEEIGKKFTEKISQMEHKPHIQLFKENGRAGEVICSFTKDAHPSLLVMGSRGQGTLRRTFLGSVSDYCVHHAHIPVVVVPPPAHSEGQAKAD